MTSQREVSLSPTVLGLLVLAAVLLASSAAPARAKSPLQLIQETPKPQYRQGHTLLPLTRWGWSMPYEVRVELAEHWGYAVEFGDASPAAVKQLDDPKSIAARLCALTVSDPKKYPLCLLARRPLLERQFIAELPEAAWCRDGEGRLIENPRKQLSPEAPDEIFARAAALAAEPIAAIRKKAPVAIVLNGGEYGLNVYGFAGKTWAQDPAAMKAKGERNWYEYFSRRKAHQEQFITDAVRKVLPERMLYMHYPTSVCPHANRSAEWWQWDFGYQWMRSNTDLPGISVYYKEFNGGFTGGNDMLTQVLNAVGGQIALGQPLSYNWLCSGWERKDMGPAGYGDAEHYMGFLKCYYTAGMIGGCAGYFAFPKGGFAADQGDQAPSWLEQMIVLAHAHATFSHLEDFIRQGDLLPGPGKHRWSKQQPAYEFPTGQPDVRVLARRHKQRAEWLIAAWAAGDKEPSVSVEIPELGKVEVSARKCGTVYRAAREGGKPVLRLLDASGMQPTCGAR